MDILHEKGYTFNGGAPISGLTAGERNVIMLGHIARNEQQQADSDAQRGRNSRPDQSLDEKMESYSENNNLRSYD